MDTSKSYLNHHQWSRRSALKAGLASLGAIASMGPFGTLARAATADKRSEIILGLQANLRSLDPYLTTAFIVRDYGYMVFDTLMSVDSKGQIKPQMLEKWDVSEDGKTYTFTLRDGLKWHDGAPVTADDCVASIERWDQLDRTGQMMAELMTSMKSTGAKTFSMTFKVPTSIALRALSKSSSQVPFMMPKKLAQTPISKPITESIGSGPFKLLMDKFQPGAVAIFVKNEDYVARPEPADGFAGSHEAKVDVVRWTVMPDPMTIVNAIKNNEINFSIQASFDLVPIVEQSKQLRVIVSAEQGGQLLMRLNHLQPPFNNQFIRQAALAAVGQEEVLQATIGNPKYYRTCPSVYGCSSPYASPTGAEHVVKADPELCKSLLKKGGYDGAKIVILRPTDTDLSGGAYVPVIAQQLQKGGFNVDVQAMDWGTELTRRTSQKPIGEGGWNIATTFLSGVDISDPISNFAVSANGKKAWFGWPTSKEIEDLRYQFATTADPDKLKQIAGEIQRLVYEVVTVVPLGEFSMINIANRDLHGILDVSVPVFWNISEKKA